MSIWTMPIDIEKVNTRGKGTMAEHLGIEFIEVGDDYLTATMPVDYRTRQPLGILNGGASVVLAETVGSTAANYCVEQTKSYCVGLDINANHLRSAREGKVIGVAKPFHIGKTTQVWEIKITNEENRLVCISRLTMAVIQR